MAKESQKWIKKIRLRNQLLGLCPCLEKVLEWRQLIRVGRRWRTEGYFVPVPYFIRRAQLLQIGKKICAEVAIETGTYRGDTTLFLARHFNQTHTIEVVSELAQLARDRFVKNSSMTVWEGDSPDILRSLLPSIKTPVIFYLDGHDSGGVTGKGTKVCPVHEELEIIFGTLDSGSVAVVIDDARLFGTDPEYPQVSEVREWMKTLCPSAEVYLEHDAIVILQMA